MTVTYWTPTDVTRCGNKGCRNPRPFDWAMCEPCLAAYEAKHYPNGRHRHECERCEAVFYSTNERTMYCSDECRKEARRAVPEEPTGLACGGCGKPVPAGRRGQVRRFCGAKCRTRSSRALKVQQTAA
jgi:hypothetical protein